jgi:uncharacterized SAM-binding protein YcdF (DUF218 family)
MPRQQVASAVLGLLFAAWLAASAFVFVWPPQDSPMHADAVVVLAGAKAPRLDKGLELMRRGVAPVLVISDGLDPLWPQANRLCRGHPGFAVVCFRPSPFSTRGEAEWVARMASARGWRSIVVVTSRYHVTRAGILFRRCFHGDVDTVGAPFELSSVGKYVASEWVKLVYEVTFARKC